MKKRFNPVLIIIAALFLAAAGIFLMVIYNSRPVLIVTEQTFLNLYGEDRVKRENFLSAIFLLRTVKTVSVANDAGDDIVSLAVTEISTQPYCVIFPLRFAAAAKIYREENPDIPIVILEGRYPINARPSSFAIGNNDSDYYIYKTDIETDFYKAGIAAAVITAPHGQKNDKNAEQIVPAADTDLEASLPAADIRPAEPAAEPRSDEGPDSVKNQPKKQIYIFWELPRKKVTAVFKQAMGDFTLERKPVFNEQKAESGEQRAESSKGDESGEEGKGGWEQGDEPAAADGEPTAESGEQAASGGEQAAESGEQAAVNGEKAASGGDKAASGGDKAAESEGQSAGEGEADAVNEEFAPESEEGEAEDDSGEETALIDDVPDDEFSALLPEIYVFSSFSDYKESSDLACVMLVDTGSDFFERRKMIPVIVFSWLNPVLMPDIVALIIDDSPWALAVRITRMVKNKVQNGVIASKFHFINKNIFNNETIRKIKKSWKNAKIEF